MSKCNKIRSIVWLRQTLRRWRSRAAARASAAASLSHSSPAAPPPPKDVPAGYVAVCVGAWRRRFVVRASHLGHPAFLQLLRQAEEEYGFSTAAGPLALPCDEELFEHVLRHISSPSKSSAHLRLEDLQTYACAAGGGESLPLLHRRITSDKTIS